MNIQPLGICGGKTTFRPNIAVKEQGVQPQNLWERAPMMPRRRLSLNLSLSLRRVSEASIREKNTYNIPTGEEDQLDGDNTGDGTLDLKVDATDALNLDVDALLNANSDMFDMADFDLDAPNSASSDDDNHEQEVPAPPKPPSPVAPSHVQDEPPKLPTPASEQELPESTPCKSPSPLQDKAPPKLPTPMPTLEQESTSPVQHEVPSKPPTAPPARSSSTAPQCSSSPEQDNAPPARSSSPEQGNAPPGRSPSPKPNRKPSSPTSDDDDEKEGSPPLPQQNPSTIVLHNLSTSAARGAAIEKWEGEGDCGDKHTSVPQGLWNVEVDKKAAEFVEKFRLPLDEVHAAMASASKFKKKHAYNKFNAKVWWRTSELNFELKQLQMDFEAHQLAKEWGTRMSNAAAAKDATFTGDRMFEELILLERRTGTR
ncbi:hypothetical protein B0H19DRAFT_1086011 [Mycena capillaripes]|nr:hypothetical protein B0H19DRAFT_1086011 [Mycena capillaripes]